jgi:uncharacterized protein
MASLAVIPIAYHAPRLARNFPLFSVRLFRRLYTSLKTLWLLALRERATPSGIAASVAVGVFAGCTPFIGFHLWIALFAATLFRLNRLWAALGSRISFFLVLPWIVLAEVQTGHRLLTGEWAPLLSSNAVARANEWFGDWCLGSIPVGGALAFVVGALAYAFAKRRKGASTLPPPSAFTPRTPAQAPPPSSGSPP